MSEERVALLLDAMICPSDHRVEDSILQSFWLPTTPSLYLLSELPAYRMIDVSSGKQWNCSMASGAVANVGLLGFGRRRLYTVLLNGHRFLYALILTVTCAPTNTAPPGIYRCLPGLCLQQRL